MKKLLLAATALSLMAAPAFAATSSATLNVKGAVKAACTAASEVVPIDLKDDLADSVTLEFNADAVNGELGSLADGRFVCNGTAAKVSIEATPLVGPELPDGAAAADFGNTISYGFDVAVTGWMQIPGDNPTLSGSTDEAYEETVGLINVSGGSITLKDAELDGIYPIAGDYEGTITVTVTPN